VRGVARDGHRRRVVVTGRRVVRARRFAACMAMAMAVALAAIGGCASTLDVADEPNQADEANPAGGEGVMVELAATRVSAGRVPVNGIEMYYEIHDARPAVRAADQREAASRAAGGVPLVLLHGGGSTLEVTFAKAIPFLAQRRRVIAVEEQGHGRTTDRDAPVAFETSADDVAALLGGLGIESADLFGFSNGASVALQVAIRHPARVRRLVFASAMTRRDGADPGLWAFMEQADLANMPQALKDAFLRVTPDEAKLRAMHDKDAERMRRFRDVPDDAIRGVRARTLVVVGDRDVVRLDHAVALARLFPDARLLVLPAGHGDYLGEAVVTQDETDLPELTSRLVLDFLDAP